MYKKAEGTVTHKTLVLVLLLPFTVIQLGATDSRNPEHVSHWVSLFQLGLWEIKMEVILFRLQKQESQLLD